MCQNWTAGTPFVVAAAVVVGNGTDAAGVVVVVVGTGVLEGKSAALLAFYSG